MDKLKNLFIAENNSPNKGFLQNHSRYALKGIPLWRTRSRLVVPTLLLGLGGLQMLVWIILHGVLYYETVTWINKVIDFGWSSINISSAYIILAHKEEIRTLGEDLDRWWNYSYLNKVTATIKKETEEWITKFFFYYKGLIFIGCVVYILLPCVKLYKAQDLDMDSLIFPVWVPFQIDTTSKFLVIYLWEVVLVCFSFMNFGEVFGLLMSFTVVISRQVRLVGVAFLTIERRVDNAMQKDCPNQDWLQARNNLLDRELVNGVIHFQHLYRSSARLRDIFSSMTNVTYHGGMWVMCSFGVKAATEMTYVMMLQAFMMISVVIGNQYIYSLISECLIEEVQNLRDMAYDSPWYKMPVKCQKTFHIFQSMLHTDRFPTPITFLGTKANMENLSKVVNASYCYFSMIITMKSS